MSADDHEFVDAALRDAAADVDASLVRGDRVFSPTPNRTPLVAAVVLLIAGLLGFAVFSGSSEPETTATVAAPGVTTTNAPTTNSPTTIVTSTTEPVSTTEQAPTTGFTTTEPSETTISPTADLVWGYDDTPEAPTWARPELGIGMTDPTYGTSVRRVTDASGTRFDRNTYSRRNPENADGTWFLTYHGDAEYHVYDRVSLDLVASLDIHPDAEPQWHPTDPGRIRHVLGPNSSVGDLRLYEVDVATGVSTVIADLTDRIRAEIPSALYMIDHAEGSPSADGNRYAWLVHDQAEDVVGIVSYDLATDTVLGIRTELWADEETLDWVSMSPSGEFVLAGYWDGTIAHNADLSGETRLTLTGEHSDIAINAAGNDAYVYIDFSAGDNGGWLMSIDLVTGDEVRIFDLYDDANTSIHLSGKGYAKPGWVVASTYSCKVDGAWSCSKVLAVELVPNGRVLNLAHTYNCGESYWTETQAAVNRDFTRVYFNTDSGSCGDDAEVMEITIPPFE